MLHILVPSLGNRWRWFLRDAIKSKTEPYFNIDNNDALSVRMSE